MSYSKTAKDLTKKEIDAYRIYLKERLENERQDLGKRYDMAWGIAKKIADILYHKFNAKSVIVFDSLTDKERYTVWSDVDLAVY
ncbi:hypothetical protein [Calorimonas adulescens]|uniref:Nucleotidyltransferase domain-containing protein n=1 Tax=Calorimonas adulescens TaxID=2606906 RepID=A0A5D8QFU3_9THEO|nr:hypothetical protein [Calorimonas adulescens]TZE83089.1 hypothetical protein FWJ32_01840 [Calorimonas adulescens]